MSAAGFYQKAPLFIVGTERSGSNLLRLILDAHPRLAIPHPPHILHFFGPLEHRYGDLGQKARLAKLTRDVLRLLTTHIHPWPHRPTVDEVVRRVEAPSLVGVQIALYDFWADAVGKPRWGCKSTFVVDYAEDVLSTVPAAKMIWLVRDPRDVAVSSMRSVFNPFHPLRTAELWDRQQRAALALEKERGRGTVHRVHYESLIEEPERVLRELFDFLHEPWDPRVLEFHARREASTSAGLCESWENTARPILRGNRNKFASSLSPREIELIEHAAGETMRGLGYATTRDHPRAPGRRERVLADARDAWLRLRVEARSARRDANVHRRWGRAALMRYLQQRR